MYIIAALSLLVILEFLHNSPVAVTAEAVLGSLRGARFFSERNPQKARETQQEKDDENRFFHIPLRITARRLRAKGIPSTRAEPQALEERIP